MITFTSECNIIDLVYHFHFFEIDRSDLLLPTQQE